MNRKKYLKQLLEYKELHYRGYLTEEQYLERVNKTLDKYVKDENDYQWKLDEYWNNSHDYKGFSILANCRDWWDIYPQDDSVFTQVEPFYLRKELDHASSLKEAKNLVDKFYANHSLTWKNGKVYKNEKELTDWNKRI